MENRGSPPVGSSVEPSANDRLDSWKEIAAYLKRDERTVRRWEQTEGLPVHRHVHQKKPTVYAYCREIDIWWNNRRPKLETEARPVHLGERGSLWPWLAAGVLVLAAGVAAWHLLRQREPDSSAPARPPGVVTRQLFPKEDPREPDPPDTCLSVSRDASFLGCVDSKTGDLVVTAIATRDRRRLTQTGDWSEGEYADHPVFSRDGRRIAYSWHSKSKIYDLRVIDLDGGALRILYRNENVPHLDPADWSADGRHVLATFERKDRTTQIVTVSVGDGAVRVLKDFGKGFPRRMLFSEDGYYVLYDRAAGDGPESDIFLLRVDDGLEKAIVQHPAHDFAPEWMPDGQSIFFLSNRTGTIDAWRVPLSDAPSEPELLYRDFGRVAPLALTEGGSFFYRLQTGLVDVYSMTMDPQTGQVVKQPQVVAPSYLGTNIAPDWSPDGRRLAYTSRRGRVTFGPGSMVLSVLEVSTAQEKVLKPPLVFFNIPRWAPDGTAILVKGTDHNDRWGNYEIDVQTGAVRRVIVQGVEGFPEYSPDGRFVYFGRRHPVGQGARIVKRELASGREMVIYRAAAPSGIMRVSVSPDGRWLAYVIWKGTASSNVLSVLQTSGGEPRELLSVIEPEWIAAHDWTPDGRYVIYTCGGYKENPKRVDLLRVAVEDGKTDFISSHETLRDVSVHPDGRRIAFTAGQPILELYVTENLFRASSSK